MNPLEPFEAQRTRLFSIAYRMLGTVMEAEDVVQEVFLRWQQVDQATVSSPQAYLTTITTRLCIDQLRSARSRRETYIGPWLPEPVVSAPDDYAWAASPNPTGDPQRALARAEVVSMAVLVLMEQLNPLERAAFLLREVFDYDYTDIAMILEKRQDHCRQLVSRARRALRGSEPAEPMSLEEQAEIAADFWSALQAGDVEGMLTLMAEDVVWWSDGGGKVTAARRPIEGAEIVARFVLNLMKQAPAGFWWRWATINGSPGLISYVGDRPINAIVIDVEGGRIRRFWAVVNPDKLASLPPAHRDP